MFDTNDYSEQIAVENQEELDAALAAEREITMEVLYCLELL